MKKYLLAFLLCFCLIGCSGKEETVAASESNESEELTAISEYKPMEEADSGVEEGAESSDSFSGMPVIHYISDSFEIGEHKIRTSGTLESYLANGFTTKTDVEKGIASGEISEEIELYCEDSSVKVKVINRYGDKIALKYGEVIYLHVDNRNSDIKEFHEFKCGETDYEKVIRMCPTVYESTDNKLVYKVGVGTFDIDIFNEKVITDSGERELIYNFKNGILDSMEAIAPALLYYGLNDNVDRSELENMKVGDVELVKKIQADISKELAKCFVDTNIDFSINEITGEVLMDNAVLFGVDEFQLTEEGKSYLDEFFKNYAKAILNNYKKVEGVVFEGHTDDTGEYEYNLELSKKRAESVLNYCLESKKNGLSDAEKSKLKEVAMTVGYSFSDPIFDDSGNIDKDASRRVAVKVFVDIK